MKNLLALVGAVVVLVVGLGWYLGWYKLTTESGHVKVDVDTQEIREDLKKGREAVGTIIDSTGKKVEGKTTSRPLEPTGPWTLPPLDAPPAPKELLFNPDGSVKSPISIGIPPPPPLPK